MRVKLLAGKRTQLTLQKSEFQALIAAVALLAGTAQSLQRFLAFSMRLEVAHSEAKQDEARARARIRAAWKKRRQPSKRRKRHRS